MASISGNYSQYSGVSGLASGMDTESVVKKLLAASTERINKVHRQKQLLTWKQEDYKSLINKLMSFKDKYFNASSSGSLSSAFYESKVAVPANAADSAYVSVSLPASTSLTTLNLQDIRTATQSKAVSDQAVSRPITMAFDSASGPVDLTGKTLELTIDGVTKTLTFSKAYASADELSSDVQQMADAAFGADRLSVTASNGQIMINSDGASATLASGAVNDALTEPGLSLIQGQTSRLDITKSIRDNVFATPITEDPFAFVINGIRFEFRKDTALSTIMNIINRSDAGVKISYSSITDKFTMTSNSTGAASDIAYADETGNFLSSVMGPLAESNYTRGTDASVYIDGVKVTRSSNVFTIDGITYNLKADTAGSITMNVTADKDKALSNIKNFVSEYNELLEALNAKVNETRYRDFYPLTDEEKSELSETERATWEGKAKSGLLRNDGTLQKVISSLREALYTPVTKLADNSTNLNITLAGIGIGTANYKSQGKLVIDEQKLADALSNNADAVISLFTQKSDKIYLPSNTQEVKQERYRESGLMYRLSDILDDSVRTTYGGGSLLQIAGYPGTSTEAENLITKSINNYQKKLDRLLDAFTREEKRYFSQFSTMETYLSQMNQQSAWISSNMG